MRGVNHCFLNSRCDLAHIWGAWTWPIGPAAIAERSRRDSKMKKLIAGTLIVCTTIVLVAVVIIRHADHKQDVAWCYDHGYANYATTDGFCVGAGGKLIKVGF
jgi:hypothetical protein